MPFFSCVRRIGTRRFARPATTTHTAWRHPERSRSSGGAKDLARSVTLTKDVAREICFSLALGHPPQRHRVTENTVEERARFRPCLFFSCVRRTGTRRFARPATTTHTDLRHPERSRSSGGAKDLARSVTLTKDVAREICSSLALGHPTQRHRVTENTVEGRARLRPCLFSHAFAGLARDVLRDQRPRPKLIGVILNVAVLQAERRIWRGVSR